VSGRDSESLLNKEVIPDTTSLPNNVNPIHEL
jgi:hypothetical protein